LAKLARHLELSGAKSGGFDLLLDRIGLGRDITLVHALAMLSDGVQAPIALLIEEAPLAVTSQAGSDVMFALKAARDELNMTHHGLSLGAFSGYQGSAYAANSSFSNQASYCRSGVR
jgi:hypothetical protein